MFRPLSDHLVTGLQVISKSESPIEKLFLLALLRTKHFVLVDKEEPQGAGFFVYPQKEVGPYRADFIIRAVGYGKQRIYPPTREVSIAVECDGAEFHEDGNAHDRERDAYFMKQGIKTFRYTGSEIYMNANEICDDLQKLLDSVLHAA